MNCRPCSGRQRWAGITSELLDIISGFEALKEEEVYEIRDLNKSEKERSKTVP